MVYTGGEGDTRFFSRVPKSPALAALWRRRRQRKKPTTPSIKATPRMPPTTLPTTTPVLLPPEAVGLLSGTVLMGSPVPMDSPVSMGCTASVVLIDWPDGVEMGVFVMDVIALGGVELGDKLMTAVGVGVKRSPFAVSRHASPPPKTRGHPAGIWWGRTESAALAEGIDNAQRTPQSAAEKNEIGRIFKERLYRPVVSKCSKDNAAGVRYREGCMNGSYNSRREREGGGGKRKRKREEGGWATKTER